MDAQQIARTYFEAWKVRDFETYRALLADDVSFIGPMATLNDADSCTKGIEGMSQIVTDIAVQKVFVDGDDVLTWFDLHTSVAPPCPTANWIRVENGKIVSIRVAFDPRPLL
jgi:ketosteroid isomerase-like protein